MARLCGHLPLALRIAGARLQHRPAWTVRHLLIRLDDERRRLAELTAEDLSVGSSFGLSYQHLGDEQRRAFRLLGLVPGASLDAYAAAAVIGADLATAQRVLDDLVDAHLLEEPAPGRYRFHDLLRHLADRIARDDEPATGCRDAQRRLLDFYLAAADAAAQHLTSVPVSGRPAASDAAGRGTGDPRLGRGHGVVRRRVAEPRRGGAARRAGRLAQLHLAAGGPPAPVLLPARILRRLARHAPARHSPPRWSWPTPSGKA